MTLREVDIELAGRGVADWIARHCVGAQSRLLAQADPLALRVIGGDPFHGRITFVLCGIGSDDFVNNAEVVQSVLEQLSQLPDCELFADADMQLTVRTRGARA
jgi:hypothetical protein